jgi:hypothetical protein
MPIMDQREAPLGLLHPGFFFADYEGYRQGQGIFASENAAQTMLMKPAVFVRL